MFKSLAFLLLLCMTWSRVQAQDRFSGIQQQLQGLAQFTPGLNESVDLSVNGASLAEFIRGIGVAHAVNLSVDDKVIGTVTNNFSNAKVSDVLLFLCRQYDLDIQIVGTILSVKKHIPPPVTIQKVTKIPAIEYNVANDFLSLDLKNDTLDQVAQMITSKSGKNVILANDIKGRVVNVFIQNRPFASTLDKMALSNGLKITKTSDDFYFVERADKQELNADANSKKAVNKDAGGKDQKANVKLRVENGKIAALEATEVDISEVIDAVSRELFKNYFFYNEVKGTTRLFVENLTYEQFLFYVLSDTEYTFKQQQGLYLIGNKKLEELRTTELLQLQNRTVESVMDVIPAELREGVELKEFVELNGILVTATYDDIVALRDFIAIVDQIVPMVIIEVIIMDVKKFVVVSSGMKAGLGDPPPSSTGTITPGLDVSLSTEAINDIISGINGFGLLNLGNVTPNFYVKLQAMEENGDIDIRSTPKLATLNGHEASMKIGTTEYYLEISNNVIGTQNPQNIITQTYKSVNADLSIGIKPVVSSDGQVTLEIEVEQSDFTGRISANAPPGSVTRNFKSVVRAKNGDVILLGGLEDNSNNLTYSGLPGIAKVPVLRWFFGVRNKDKSEAKLSIIVKPTIIY